MLGKILRDMLSPIREASPSLTGAGQDRVSQRTDVASSPLPIAASLPQLSLRDTGAPIARNQRNLLTLAYDESKLSQLDFDVPASRVRCFWSGSKPNDIAMLSLRSFVQNDHAVCLYTYDNLEELAAQMPSGVCVRSAEDIVARSIYDECLARSEVRYFSDIFRYAALYRFGGWWIDTDVVLLRPLPSVNSYFF